MNLPPDRPVTRSPEPSLHALPTRWSRMWAVVVLIATVAVAIASLTGAPEIVRAPITLGFIAICPGMAIVRLLRLDEPLAEVMLAFALSLALAGLVPAVFLYVGAWSPAWSLTGLVVIAATGLALDPVVVPRHGWASLGRALRGRVLVLAGRVDPAIADARPLVPTRRSGQGSLAPHRPPPMAVVRRLRTRARPMSANERSRNRALGPDPLEEESSIALRSTFDRIVGDIASRRQRDD